MGFTNYDMESMIQANELIVLTLDTISQDIKWRISQNKNVHYFLGNRSDGSIEVITVYVEDLTVTECVVNDENINDLSLVEHLLLTIMFSVGFYRVNYNKFLNYLNEKDLSIDPLNGRLIPFNLDYEDEEREITDDEDEGDEVYKDWGEDEDEENDFWGLDEYYESEDDLDDEGEKDTVNTTAGNYFDRLNPESILTEYGYSVAKNINLSKEERRRILKDILKNESIPTYKIINHLQWCIDNHTQKNQKEARYKWRSDIDYLKSISHWN